MADLFCFSGFIYSQQMRTGTSPFQIDHSDLNQTSPVLPLLYSVVKVQSPVMILFVSNHLFDGENAINLLSVMFVCMLMLMLIWYARYGYCVVCVCV